MVYGDRENSAFTRFFDGGGKSLDVMLQWLREAMRTLPLQYASLLLFCTLTGMRGSECIESINLINQATPAVAITIKSGISYSILFILISLLEGQRQFTYRL